MRLTILGSGSTGNALLVEAGPTRFLVDAGVPVRTLRERAAPLGIDLDLPLAGVVLTHAHCDHASQTDTYVRAFGAPLFLTESTRRGLKLRTAPRTRVFGPQTSFRVGEVEVHPHPVPHDAPQTALVFQHGAYRAGLVTDLGVVRRDLVEHLRGCGAVLLESNYDPELLRLGPYPPSVQARVAGPKGHLSNAQCADLLSRLDKGTREVVLVHVSENNNQPNLAWTAADRALGGRQVRLRVAAATEPLRVDVPKTAQQLSLF